MTGKQQLPKLTPKQVRDERQHLQNLYGERALPKVPEPPKPEPGK